MDDRFSKKVAVDVPEGADLWVLLERLHEAARTAVSEAPHGYLTQDLRALLGNNEGRITRPSIRELRRALESHDFAYFTLFLDVEAWLNKASARASRPALSAEVQYFNDKNFRDLSLKVEGSDRLLVDGLHQRLTRDAKRIVATLGGDPPEVAPLADPPSPAASQAVAPPAAPVGQGSAQPSTRTWPRTALKSVGGIATTLLTAYLIYRFGWN